MGVEREKYFLSLCLAGVSFLTLREKNILLKKLDSAAALALLSIDDIATLVGRTFRAAVWNGPSYVREAEKAERIIKAFGIETILNGEALYPALLSEAENAPFMLFCRGNASCLSGETVSVVGTRRMTREGKEAAFSFARDAARAGVTVVSGLAYGIDGAAHAGAHVVWGSSATFIQRTYDQLTQDLALNQNPAVIVGSGSIRGLMAATHQGLSSISMIANIPNMVYLAPSNAEEYIAMLDWALEQDKHPVYIAIPSGPVVHAEGPVRTNFDELNTYEVTRQGSKVAVLALGDFYDLGEKTVEALSSTLGIEATLVKPYFASGVDQNLLDNLVKDHDVIVTIEDGIIEGGWGQNIASYLGTSPARVLNYGVKKAFYDRVNIADLMRESHLEPELIAADVKQVLGL